VGHASTTSNEKVLIPTLERRGNQPGSQRIAPTAYSSRTGSTRKPRTFKEATEDSLRSRKRHRHRHRQRHPGASAMPVWLTASQRLPPADLLLQRPLTSQPVQADYPVLRLLQLVRCLAFASSDGVMTQEGRLHVLLAAGIAAACLDSRRYARHQSRQLIVVCRTPTSLSVRHSPRLAEFYR
jgi:hypothetical protein